MPTILGRCPKVSPRIFWADAVAEHGGGGKKEGFGSKEEITKHIFAIV